MFCCLLAVLLLGPLGFWAMPRDLDGFAAVNGVGAAKLKDFGALFLDAIAAHAGEG